MTMLATMSEDTRIAEVVDRLKRSYPTLPADLVIEVVNEMRVAFHGSCIRDYVPLFVERRARSALTELAV
jgi:DNA polymerase II small subunit/DNA polymerase delta subunit B